jgi:uncharacterized protein YprB with RNaseH-like and TPR domain/DNA-directed RNA polymerase subunit RPC12/RpoP
LKILFLDIETAPNKAFVWGLFDQNISHDQLEESSYILCWSAKWLGEKKIYFESAEKQDRRTVLAPIHHLLDGADVVVHFNGAKFDIPILNREFIKHGLTPPAPYKQIDLLRVVKRAFRFESNKLAYITQALGLQGKVKHEGFQLWVGCMNGDRKAWRTMERYNRNDVAILEPLYTRLLPWIGNHPSLAYDGLACPKCGSKKTQSRGVQVAVTQTYQRYQCQGCGGWFRSNKVLVKDRGERGVNIAI